MVLTGLRGVGKTVLLNTFRSMAMQRLWGIGHMMRAVDRGMAKLHLTYERLITCVRPSAHPYMLRIWNYFGGINAGDGEAPAAEGEEGAPAEAEEGAPAEGEEGAPLVKEADPELERLLAEEEEIERRTRQHHETPHFRSGDE